MSEHSKIGAQDSLDRLRSPGRGMNFGRASIARVASVLVPLLAEISRGDTSLRAEVIFELGREDPEWARILTALLMLHGDIEYRLKAAELAGAQRHQSARYIAVGLLLDAALDLKLGRLEAPSEDSLAAAGQASLQGELAALRGAVEAMPSGEAAEQVRTMIRGLEARVAPDAPVSWTPWHEQRDSTLAVTLKKLQMTASEMFAYLGRTCAVEVPAVSMEAELRWMNVESSVRLWWLRAVGGCLKLCAREDLHLVAVDWSASHAGDETPASLRMSFGGAPERIDALEQSLSQWVARMNPALSLVNADHPWRVKREGAELSLGVEAWAFERAGEVSGDFLHRQMRIVVVDDEPIIASVVHRVLSRRLSVPCEFQVFTSSEEALAALSIGPEADLVISDVNMPSISGDELYARSVEAHEGLAHRFVFVSGMELPASLLESYRLGMVEFVRKPFRPEELVGAVNRVVERIAATVAAQ